METADQLLLVDRLDPDLDLVVGDGVEDLVDAAGHALQEILHLDYVLEDVARREAFLHPLLHDLGGALADRFVGVEVGVELVADLVQVEQGLAEHRQLCSRDEAESARHLKQAEDNLSDLNLLDGRVLLRCHEVRHRLRETHLVEHRRLLRDT